VSRADRGGGGGWSQWERLGMGGGVCEGVGGGADRVGRGWMQALDGASAALGGGGGERAVWGVWVGRGRAPRRPRGKTPKTTTKSCTPNRARATGSRSPPRRQAN